MGIPINRMSIIQFCVIDTKKQNCVYFRSKDETKLCNTDENGQPNNTCLETVGCVFNRYRLVHRWVPEMVLNVQSDSLIENLFLGPRVIFPYGYEVQ